MKISQAVAGMLLFAGLGSACSFYARDAEEYKRVTRELVDSRGSAIKSCYDVELATNAAAGGKVVVAFTVEKKTGRIIGAQPADGTTASPALSQCVLAAIDGLQLDPPDRRDGIATFVWEFRANAAEPEAPVASY